MRPWLRILVLVWMLGSYDAQSISPLVSRGQQQDRKALLALKGALVGSSPNRLKAWTRNGSPCSPKPWPYITCTGDRVTGLNLPNLGLAGTLPADLRKASELVTLNLADNKLTGTLPEQWANQQSFKKLRTLNLANNNFDTVLPVWSRINSWRNLEVLDLSANKFWGGLPTSWMIETRLLRSVKLLDLSSNLLGYGDGGTADNKVDITDQLTTAQWCGKTGTRFDQGWCPEPVAPATIPLPGTLASLEIFDISNNDLAGSLPPLWPKMMPRLTTLLMHGNFISRDATAIPTPLPDSWAGGSKRGWPALQQLVLYPGNPYLCSILENGEGDYRDVNLESAYRVLDNTDGQWGAENPAICPLDLDSDQQVEATVDLTASKLTFSYGDAGTAAALLQQIYGFRVTISHWVTDGDGDSMFVPLADWSARVLRSYTGSTDYSAAVQSSVTFNTEIQTPEVIKADAGFPYLAHTISPALTTTGAHKVSIAVVALDGSEGPWVEDEVAI